MRQMVIEKYLQGQDLNTPDVRDFWAEWKFPAMITCQRWIDIFHEIGDICPKRATGNRHSEREILGPILEKLALYHIVFPKATQAECRAHLYNLDPTVDPYSTLSILPIWFFSYVGHFEVKVLPTCVLNNQESSRVVPASMKMMPIPI
jgi:hypothetical protein